MSYSEFDLMMMQKALALAAQGKYSTSPNPRVGCILVRDQQIVGEGFHLLAGTPHAEVNALKQADKHAQGATAYVTLEPCSHFGRTPPCAQALIDHKIKKVFIATLDPNPLVAGRGAEKLKQAGITVNIGLMANEAQEINRGFFSRIQRKRPFVKLKCATSLDGKIALNNGQSQWITSEDSRQKAQQIRAESCAILTGIQTVISDNPALNVRAFETLRQPKRIIADTHLRTPLNAKILIQSKSAGQTLIATCVEDAEKHKAYLDLGVQIITLPKKADHIDLNALLTRLAQLEIGELMIEAGSTINGAFLQSKLVDEINWFYAAKILGDKGKNVFTLPEYTSLSDINTWKIIENAQINESDIYLRLQKSS